MEGGHNRGDDSSSSSRRVDSKSKKGSKRKSLRVKSFPQPLPPEVAAQYLSQASAAAAVAWEKNASNSNSKDSTSSSSNPKPFGPSRPPPTKSASLSFGSLDLAALAQSGSLDFAAAAAAANRSSSSSGDNSSPPCSEAEMKALMSMFVEIMGMSMDPDNSGKSSSPGRKSVSQAAQSFLAAASSSSSTGNSNGSGSSFPVFMFGNSSGKTKEIPPPPGGWPSGAAAAAAAAAGMSIPPDAEWGVDYYDEETDDDEEDDESIPDLDHVHGKKSLPDSSKQRTPAKATKATNEYDTGFSPAALAALEQVEMDDALQEEERARKAAKKREKKQRKKEKAKKEAAIKASQAAQKKREKLVLSWRSRVVSACQSNEVTKLETLLSESPLRPPKTHEETPEETNAFIKSNMEYLLPNCIAKTRQQVEKGREARQTLANFIMNWSIDLIFTTGRNGRTAFHTACMNGDVYFVQFALERAINDPNTPKRKDEHAYANEVCEDSGWSPLHYAAVCGSNHVIEALMTSEGCDINTVTDDTRTWRISNGDGITARELAEIVRSGKYDRILECDGDALKDVVERHLENANSGERSRFNRVLEKMIDRLTDVERNGYSPPKDPVPSLKESDSQEEDEAKLSRRSSSVGEDLAKKKKKKKKKEKQQQQSETEAPKPVPSKPEPEKPEDPMITALLGMGFTAEQIDAAAKACGGTDRATADDLVMWIFGQESGETEPTAPESTNESANVATNNTEEANEPEEVPFTDPAESQSEKNKTTKEQREQAAAQAQQELLDAAKREEESRKAAQRLAAKREEQRRRNREWNNREQARQREEAQAKLTEEMQRRARVEAQRVTMERMAAQQQQQPQLHMGTNVGVPQQVSYTAAPHVAREPQPQQTMGAPTHVLQSNGKIRPLGGFAQGGASAPALPRNQPQTQNAPSPYPPEARQMPPSPAPGMVMEAVPMRTNRPPGYAMAFGQQQQKMTGPSNMESSSYEYHEFGNEGKADNMMPVIPPEDATVSSAGSGRPPRVPSGSNIPMAPPGMHVPSSTPPPGFRPPQQTTSPSAQFTEEPNPLGEIRATAKAFVPTNFKPVPQAQPLERVSTAPSSMPPTPPPGEFSAPAPRMTRSSSDVPMGGFGGGGDQPASDPMLDPVSSLLGGVGSFQSGSSSLLPASSTRLPAALDQSPVPSAASSVTGAVPVSSSSLLDPVALGGGTSSADGIWGSSGTTTSTATSSTIGGLPSFGFGEGGATSSIGRDPALRTFGTVDDMFGAPGGNGGNNTNWGSSGEASGTGNSNGLGSIW